MKLMRSCSMHKFKIKIKEEAIAAHVFAYMHKYDCYLNSKLKRVNDCSEIVTECNTYNFITLIEFIQLLDMSVTQAECEKYFSDEYLVQKAKLGYITTHKEFTFEEFNRYMLKIIRLDWDED